MDNRVNMIMVPSEDIGRLRAFYEGFGLDALDARP